MHIIHIQIQIIGCVQIQSRGSITSTEKNWEYFIHPLTLHDLVAAYLK